MQGPPSAIQICGACGVVAPTERTSCSLCGGAFSQVRVAAPVESNGAFWVAVRAGFTCRSCAFLAPLDQLDVDGAVECAQCSLRQAFDVSAWQPALAFAHAVGDLAGPNPEGRAPHTRIWIGDSNPLRAVGVSLTTKELSSWQAGSPLTFEAGPGHPVCRTCRAPLATNHAQQGVVETRCERCGESARFALPERASELCSSLVGVVAAEHSDRQRARATTGESGVVTLSCPGCGAPLTAEQGARTAQCTFCRVVSLVPARASVRSGARIEAAVFWLLFQGLSPKRVELETPTMVLGGGDPQALVFGGLDALRKRFKPAADKEDGPREIEIAPEEPGIGALQGMATAACILLATAITYPIVAAASGSSGHSHTTHSHGHKR